MTLELRNNTSAFMGSESLTSCNSPLKRLSAYATDIYPFRLSMWEGSLRGFRRLKKATESSGLPKRLTSVNYGSLFPYYIVPRTEMDYFDCEGVMSVTHGRQKKATRSLIFVSDQIPDQLADLWAIRERMLMFDDYRCSGNSVSDTECFILEKLEKTFFSQTIEEYIKLRLKNVHDRMFAIEAAGQSGTGSDRLIKDLSRTAYLLGEKAKEHNISLTGTTFPIPQIPITKFPKLVQAV